VLSVPTGSRDECRKGRRWLRDRREDGSEMGRPPVVAVCSSGRGLARELATGVLGAGVTERMRLWGMPLSAAQWHTPVGAMMGVRMLLATVA
jgi:hypothetical protein